jgi:hypothetical protein
VEKDGRNMRDIDLTLFGTGPDPAEVEKLIALGFNWIVFYVPPLEGGEVLRLLDRYQGVAAAFA